jgi:two-component system, sensor histidine kinase LadS
MNDFNHHLTSYEAFLVWVSEQKRRMRRIPWGGLLLGACVIASTVWLWVSMARLTEQAGLPGATPALMVDGQALLDIESVARLPENAFVPVPDTIARGYTSDVHWFRLEVPAGVDGTATVLVQPSSLDDVRLYVRDPLSAGGWQTHRQGDHQPFAERTRKLLSFAADLQARPGEVVFVRVQTRNASNMRVRLLSAAAAERENALTLAGAGLYGGALLVLACASALSAIVFRDRFWGANALFQLATLTTMATYFGLSNQFLFPDEPALSDRVSILCGFTQFFFGNLFYRLLSRLYGAPAWLTHLQALVLLAFPVQLGLMAWGRADWALQLYNVALPVTILLGSAMVVVLKCHDSVLLNLLRLNMLSITTCFVLLYVTHLGWLEAGFMQLYPGVFINLFTAVVLHLVLVRRHVLLDRDRDRAHRNLVLSQQHVDFQRSKREEDGRFLSMLLHEMRSPLAVLLVAAKALGKKLSTLPLADEVQEGAARDVSRIDKSVRQMRDMLQQVQVSSEMEHRVGLDFALHSPNSPARCNADEVSAVLASEHESMARLDVSGLFARMREDQAVAGNAQIVSMMVGNLIDNAVKYAAADSSIRMHSSIRAGSGTSSQRWCLALSNDVGPIGFPDPQRLFTKYYRAPGARQHSGTGLGLYWVRGMARILGGDLIHHARGDQVVFELSLPIIEGEPSEEEEVSQPMAPL